MNDFENKIQVFWEKTQKVYNVFTQKGGVAENTDYYVFQTQYYHNPKLMIIGINPGGNGKSSRRWLFPKNKENMYLSADSEWFKNLQKIFGYPNNEFLKNYLENAVGTNRFFINTGNAKELNKEIKKSTECTKLIRDLVNNIIQPEKIIALGTDPFCTFRKAKSVQIKEFGKLKFKYSNLDDIPICFIPNPSKINQSYFNTDEKNKEWQKAIEWFLKI